MVVDQLQLTYRNLQPNYTLSSGDFAAALKGWLVDALKGPDGRERPHEPLFAAPGFPQATFYKILAGKGGTVRQSRVTAIAMAVGTSVPMIDRVLRLPGDPLYVRPMGPASADRAVLDDADARKAQGKGSRQPPAKKGTRRAS